MSPRLLGAIALGALSVGLLGCEPDLELVRLTAVTSPPVSPTITSESMRLAAGTGIALDVTAYTDDTDDPPLDPDGVDVRSRDTNVVSVLHVEEGTYIVVGARPGTTILEVRSQDAAGVWEIAAEVVEQ